MSPYLKQLGSFFYNTEIWFVAVAVAASIVSTRALLPALAIILAFFLFRRWGQGRLSIRMPIDWSIVVLIATLLITVIVTVQPSVTYPQVYRLLIGIGLTYSMANWADSDVRLHLIAMGITFAGATLALSAPFTVQWITSKFSFIPKAFYARLPLLTSDGIHSNVMGGTLAILFPLSLAILLFGWSTVSRLERVFYLASALLMGSVIVFSQSRGALMGIMVAFFGLIILRWQRGWWLIIPILAGTVFISYSRGLAFFIDQTSANSAISALDGRQEVWSRAFYIIQDFPFTGIGMGNFSNVADMFYPFFLAAPGQPHAHNLFLQIAVDLGIPGLIAWLSIWFLICAISWQVYYTGKAVRDYWLAGIGAGLLASQIVLIVHGTIDAVTWGVRPAVTLWSIWGLALATLRTHKNNRSDITKLNKHRD